MQRKISLEVKHPKSVSAHDVHFKQSVNLPFVTHTTEFLKAFTLFLLILHTDIFYHVLLREIMPTEASNR